MLSITLEKAGVESGRRRKAPAKPDRATGGPGPQCAGAGAAPRRPQLQGKSSRRDDPAGIR